MITLLVGILIVVLLIAFEAWIVGLLPIAQPFKGIVLAIVAVLTVVWYFNAGHRIDWFH